MEIRFRISRSIANPKSRLPNRTHPKNKNEVQKVSVQGSARKSYETISENIVSVPDRRVFPPPGDHFSTPTTESRIYDWAAQAAQ